MDNKVKFGEKIYTLQPIILCYMDIPMHPSFKKIITINYGDICL